MKPSEVLQQHRQTIRQIVQRYRISNPRIFGSVLHGTDTEHSSTHLDRIAGIYITGTEKGVLAAQAGKDITSLPVKSAINQSKDKPSCKQGATSIWIPYKPANIKKPILMPITMLFVVQLTKLVAIFKHKAMLPC